MLKSLFRKTVVIIFLFNLNFIYAWGPDGHHYVAEIAKMYLNKDVKQKVQNVLGAMTFDEAAVWMDEIKKDHAYDALKPWHYIDFDKDKTYVKTEEANIVNALEQSIAKLKNKKALTDDEINTYVKYLFHIVGDLHMPLHTGYPQDKGGNDIKLDFMGKQKNLHYVWDMGMIEYKKITVEDCIKAGSSFSKEEIKTMQKIDVVKWMEESRSYLPQVYDIKNETIDEAYIDRSIPIIEKQIFKAGIRLAAVLNEAFKK